MNCYLCKQALGLFVVFLLVPTHGLDRPPQKCLQDYSSEISADLDSLQILEYASEEHLNNQYSNSLDKLLYKINSTKIFLEAQEEQAKELGNTAKCDVDEKKWQQIDLNFRKQIATLADDLIDQLRERKNALVKIGNDNEKNLEKLNDEFNTCVSESCLTLILLQCETGRKIFQSHKLEENFTAFTEHIEKFATDKFSTLNRSEEIVVSHVVEMALTCLFEKISADFVKTQVDNFRKTLEAIVGSAQKNIVTLANEELGALKEDINDATNQISRQVNERAKKLDEEQIEAGNISNRSIPCNDYKKSFEEESSSFENVTTLMYQTLSEEILRNLNLLDAELENYKAFSTSLENQLENCQKNDMDCFRKIYIASILSLFNLSIIITDSKDKFIHSNIHTFNKNSDNLTTALFKSLSKISQISETSQLCMYDFAQTILTMDIKKNQRKSQKKCFNLEKKLGAYEFETMRQAREYSNQKYDQLLNDSFRAFSKGCYSLIDPIVTIFSSKRDVEINTLEKAFLTEESNVLVHCNNKFDAILHDIEFCLKCNYKCLENIQEKADEIFENISQDIANAIYEYQVYANDGLSKMKPILDSYFTVADIAVKHVDKFCNNASHHPMNSFAYFWIVVMYVIKIKVF